MMNYIEILDKDIAIDTYRASGAKRNKTDSVVRIPFRINCCSMPE